MIFLYKASHEFVLPHPLANKVNNMIDDLQKFYIPPTKKEYENLWQ